MKDNTGWIFFALCVLIFSNPVAVATLHAFLGYALWIIGIALIGMIAFGIWYWIEQLISIPRRRKSMVDGLKWQAQARANSILRDGPKK